MILSAKYRIVCYIETIRNNNQREYNIGICDLDKNTYPRISLLNIDSLIWIKPLMVVENINWTCKKCLHYDYIPETLLNMNFLDFRLYEL